LLVIGSGNRLWVIGLLKRADFKQTAAFLAKVGLRVQPIKSIPALALPRASVGRRGLTAAAVCAAAGMFVAGVGFLARPLVHGRTVGRPLDQRAAARLLTATAAGETLREHTAPDETGIAKARISTDGRWTWGLGAATKRHFIWHESQAEPVGQPQLPAGQVIHAAFTSDSRLLGVSIDRQLRVWQLEPLEERFQVELPEYPGGLISSPDGSTLFVPSMTSLRAYDLADGAKKSDYSTNLGAVVCAALSDDGRRAMVIYQSRIASIDLREGNFEELLRFARPNAVYFFGSLSAGGRWAAMQSPQGTDVYDLEKREKLKSIAAGMATFAPAISADGTRMAAAHAQGAAVWNVATGQPVVQYAAPTAVQLEWCANQNVLLGYGHGVPRLFIWKLPAR
jgi:hypothetical protein